MKILHVVLRPGFAICLFLSQFTSHRNSYFTDHVYMILIGVVLSMISILLLFVASTHLGRAKETGRMATSGPYRYIRHPIYTSIYLLSFGLGFLFFAWIWFLVMVVFIPLWWLESKEEEKEMLEKYDGEYLDYQERTKMFIPGLV